VRGLALRAEGDKGAADALRGQLRDAAHRAGSEVCARCFERSQASKVLRS
jgi:hypothetical protein